MIARTSQSARLAGVVAAVVLAATLVGSQALAGAHAPAGGVASTGKLVGQTSSAYLGGLRTFAAAVLWNRIDPQFHQYYGASFDESFGTFTPTVRMVQALDPQFIQAYYVAAYWIARHKSVPEGLQIAEEGIDNNPQSGLMRANYVQIALLAETPDMTEIMKQATIGIGADMQWASHADEFEGLGIFSAAFNISGDTATVAKLKARQAALPDDPVSPE
ncbi:MAG: hypothetical protein HGA39_06905 [Coriobacteriia bacterium]|nr:hypothetical protein [Coriobacteriia bacterium]